MISALHKSMRNSDPDAAVYYLCRMLDGGADPLYIARRLVRFASEDVGMACLLYTSGGKRSGQRTQDFDRFSVYLHVGYFGK